MEDNNNNNNNNEDQVNTRKDNNDDAIRNAELTNLVEEQHGNSKISESKYEDDDSTKHNNNNDASALIENGKRVIYLKAEAANAFNTQMAYELTDLFEQLSLDAGDCRVVVLTATGSKAFCAGGDLKERNGMTDKAWEAQHLVYERMVRAVMSCPVPGIAAGNG